MLISSMSLYNVSSTGGCEWGSSTGMVDAKKTEFTHGHEWFVSFQQVISWLIHTVVFVVGR